MRLLSATSPINWRAPLNRGLLRWWLCLPQKHGGNTWRELTGKSNATISGAAVVGPRGRQGGWGSYEFDGATDSGQAAAIDLSTVTTLTVSYWSLWNSYALLSNVLIESSADSNANTGAILITPDRNVSGGLYFARVRASGSNGVVFARPSANVWHHFVICFDRGGGSQQVVAVYVDGVSQSLTSSGTSSGNTGGFGNYAWNFMARDAGASLLGAGKLDDVRLHNRILSASEAQQLYRASRFRYPNELRWLPDVPLSFEAEEDTPPETPEEIVNPITLPWSYTMASPIAGAGQTITNTTLASATSLTVPAGAKYAEIQAIGQNFNYFINGDTPTTGTTGDGKKLYAGSLLTLNTGLTTAKFIREADTANSKLVVEYFGGVPQ